MAVIGSVVKVRGQAYIVVGKRHEGHKAEKLWGRFTYTVLDAEGDEYTA